MTREIRMKAAGHVVAAAEEAAIALGLTIAGYTRMALLERLARDGHVTVLPSSAVSLAPKNDE